MVAGNEAPSNYADPEVCVPPYFVAAVRSLDVDMADAPTRIEDWRIDYNQNRPHTSLNGDPPPVKWSDSKYGFLPEEDRHGERRDTRQKRSSRSYVRWTF